MEKHYVPLVLNRKVSEIQCYLCPHKAVKYLANIGAVEYESDRRKYIWIQTRLGFVLLSVLGGTKLQQFGYPYKPVTEILEMVLCKTKTKVNFLVILLIENCKREILSNIPVTNYI